jgi:hypothetical protein
MALRLIEMVVQEKDSEDILELLKEHKVLEHRHLRLPDGEVLVRILLDAERSEAVLDLTDRGDGGGSIVAADGGVRAAAGRRASGSCNGRVVAIFDEPDLCEPGQRDDVSSAGHTPGNLVGEKSVRESDAYSHRDVGGIERHDPVVAQGLNVPG